jgi:hypothetical protein
MGISSGFVVGFVFRKEVYMVWILVAVSSVPNVFSQSLLPCVRLRCAIPFTELFIQGPNSMFKMAHIFKIV